MDVLMYYELFSFYILTWIITNLLLSLYSVSNNTVIGKPKRFYSSGCKLSECTSPSIEPWFITGFADAEGCFTFTLSKTTQNKIGWESGIYFIINLHERDKHLLSQIKAYFGDVGTIGKARDNCCAFKVRSLNSIITKVIPHFDKYPLVTNKRFDYLLWREIAMKMQRGEHLTVEGLQSIVNIRASLNKGLRPSLQEAFPNSTPVLRDSFLISSATPPLGDVCAKLHPQWVAGFISGEGSFTVDVRKSVGYKIGERVSLGFRFNQHIRDESLIRSFVDYFGCGSYFSYKDYAEYKCQAFQCNYDIIIPFFQKYHVLGVKSQDFSDWCKIADIIKTQAHLTEEGLSRIKEIKARMNKGRKP